MKKVITYGTFDLLHRGHIRLLKRAKELGDYLIVGVTSDMYDKERGKINVRQSVVERIDALRDLGFIDKIIIEEYQGQKIDDIQKYNIDIFAIGSDWKGKFDYLSEYCELVYLERTEGISSSQIRSENSNINLGFSGESSIINKLYQECLFVNGLNPIALYARDKSQIKPTVLESTRAFDSYTEFLSNVDAVYIISNPIDHYHQIKEALQNGKHVICESPIVAKRSEYIELKSIADQNKLILMDAIKTAYSQAYHHLLLHAKSGAIGSIISIDTVCTSLRTIPKDKHLNSFWWNGFYSWAPTAMLPIFDLLGTDWLKKSLFVRYNPENPNFDDYSRILFVYNDHIASCSVGEGGKSEGSFIISGSKGYIYVPAPWWKTDYFELRFENPNDNKRIYYKLEGEGLRNMLSVFLKSIKSGYSNTQIGNQISEAIIGIVEDFNNKIDTIKF